MRQPTDDELDAIRDEIAWGRIAGDTYILPAIAEYVLKLQDEIERLRAERINETGKSAEMYEQLHREVERLRATVNGLNAEIDDKPFVTEIAALIAERDAALAENERLRNSLEEMHIAWAAALDGLMAWRACADQLALVLRNLPPTRNPHPWSTTPPEWRR